MRWAVAAWDRVSQQTAARDYHMSSLFLPNAQTWAVGPRIRFFRDAGAQWYSSEIIGRSSDCDLSLYIVARMLWDADRDPDAIVKEYFPRYFGAAAEPMEAYYRYLNDMTRNVHWNSSTKYGEFFNATAVTELRSLLAPALHAGQGDVIIRQRLRREELALDVYAAMVRIWVACDTWRNGNVRTAEAAADIRSAIAAMDALLTQVSGMQLVAARCAWWEMFRETRAKELATTQRPAEAGRAVIGQ